MPKLPKKVMDELFFDHEFEDEDVVCGPKYGEDAAVVKIGDQFLVMHSDPISGAVEEIGWFAVHIAANDIAVSGAAPRWALPTIQISPETSKEELKTIVNDMKEACRELGIALIGGHTETVNGLDRPMVTTTMLGITSSPIYTSDSETGDKIIQFKEAGIEGTWVLVNDFEEELLERGISREMIKEVKTWREEISVVSTALSIKDKVTAMHDPTEGGILQGLYEMSTASGLDFVVDEEIMIRDETEELCEALDIDPLKLISSGCVIATSSRMLDDDVDFRCKVIGTVKGSEERTPSLSYMGKPVEENPGDELFEAIEKLS